MKTIGKSSGILTVLGIAIGVASVMIISEIGRIGKETVENEILSMGMNTVIVTSNYDKNDLNEDTLSLIKELTDESYVSAFTVNYCEAQMRGLTAKSGVMGVDNDFNRIIPVTLKYGRLINRNDIISCRRACVIDDKAAKDFYGRENIVGKKINIKIGGYKELFEIVGVVQSGGNLMHSIMETAAPYIIYIPYTSVWQITEREEFSQISVKMSDTDKTEDVINLLNDRLNGGNYYGKFNISSMSSQSKKLSELLDKINIILSGIAGISLAVSGLSIMTVMLIYVKDKTLEIGIKKAIGAKKASIICEFILYACRLCFRGILYGLTTAFIFMLFVAAFMKIKFSFNYNCAFIISCITFAITVVFSAYPTAKAASLNPIDALHYE